MSRSFRKVAAMVLCLSLPLMVACGASPPNQTPIPDEDLPSTTVPAVQPQADVTVTTADQTSITVGPKGTSPTSSTSTSAPTTSLPVAETTTTVDTPPPTIDYDEPTEGFESEEPNNNDQFVTYEPDT